MSLIKGIHHAALKCADLKKFEETVHFYRDVLGLPVLRRWGNGEKEGIMFDTGNGLIEIFASGSTGRTTGSVNHFALATDDTDACIAAVRKAGYTIAVEPKDITIASQPPLPARIAFAVGPCGEEIEFFQEK